MPATRVSVVAEAIRETTNQVGMALVGNKKRFSIFDVPPYQSVHFMAYLTALACVYIYMPHVREGCCGHSISEKKIQDGCIYASEGSDS